MKNEIKIKRVQIWHDGLITELNDNEEAKKCSICGKTHECYII